MRGNPLVVAVAVIAVLGTMIYMAFTTYQDIKREVSRPTYEQQQALERLQQNDMSDEQYGAPADPADPGTSSVPVTGDLQPMTGEECAAAGAEAGWSATWGPASDGCWIIKPDGSEIKHLGTWKE